MKRLLSLIGLGTLIAVLGVFAAVALATQPQPAFEHKVDICHATPPDTAANGWNSINVDVASVGYQRSGHQDEHAADIIPAWSYQKPGEALVSYSGKNLATDFGGYTGAEILENNCEMPSPPPSEDVFAAQAVCDIDHEEYGVSGTVNGQAAQVTPKTIAGDFAGNTTVDVKLGSAEGHATVTTDGKCVGTPPPPPHEVTGGASVACILPDGYYRVSGTVDGHAADDVNPATIPGNTKGNTEVRVTRGDTTVRTTVSTNGDCGNAPTPSVVPPPAVETTTPATPTTPTAPLTPPTTKPVAKKPAAKKPAAKPAPAAPKQAVAGALAKEPPKLAYTP